MWRCICPPPTLMRASRWGHDSVNQSMDPAARSQRDPQILDGGYNYDFIDDDASPRWESSIRYWCCRTWREMPLKTLVMIAEYARKGGIVIAHRPRSLVGAGIPGSQNGHAGRFHELAQALFERGRRAWAFGEGRCGAGRDAARLLKPDVTAPPEIGSCIASWRGGTHTFWSTLPTIEFMARWDSENGAPLELWDPFTGKTSELPAPRGNRY